MVTLFSVVHPAWFQDGSFVNYWLKHDGMIVRIPVYLSSLLLALTSKFYAVYFEKH